MMRRIVYPFLVLLVTTAAVSPAFPESSGYRALPRFSKNCRPTPSNLDESFGLGQMGQPYTELLPALKPVPPTPYSDQRCYRQDNTSYDCSFTDATGIEYEDGGKGLEDKSILIPDMPRAVLPFGLAGGDTLEDVKKKTRPYLKRASKIERDFDMLSYVSGLCYVNARGKRFSLNFHFKDGKLISMHVASEDEFIRDPTQ